MLIDLLSITLSDRDAFRVLGLCSVIKLRRLNKLLVSRFIKDLPFMQCAIPFHQILDR